MKSCRNINGARKSSKISFKILYFFSCEEGKHLGEGKINFIDEEGKNFSIQGKKSILIFMGQNKLINNNEIYLIIEIGKIVNELRMLAVLRH